jgi:hypothetical protein
MNVAQVIPPDELLLARLASAKLAKLISGLMSVGVSSLQLESPAGFLANRDKVLLGFIEVLRCIGVKPGNGESQERLRHQADELFDLARQFHQHFIQLAAWRTLSPPQVQATADGLLAKYAALCQALAVFRNLLGEEADPSAGIQQGQEMLAAFLEYIGDPVTPDNQKDARNR